MFNVAWKVLCLLGVVGAAAWWAGSREEKSGETAHKPVKYEPAPRRPLLEPDERYHGVAWQIHNSKGCVEKARRIIGEIADLGADTILISNAGYQEHAGSESFKIDPKVTPTPEEWEKIFGVAHDNGLRVILMPIILLSEPRGNEWRGVINPPSWDDWFAQYRRFIGHFARLAADNDVEMLMIGSEFVSSEKYTDQWEKVIRHVRGIYPGLLSYSSNWDHYKVIQFWDKLDMVGMTSYYKLADEPGPSLKELIQAWEPLKRGLLRWQEKVGKPLLFTEVGWCSQEGASIEPWNYYYDQNPTKAGLVEQRRCYRAFIETWENTPEVGGVIWWEWTDTRGGPGDYNYTPKGKPAERILREWFSRVRQRQMTSTQPMVQKPEEEKATTN
jgi:hypothetical protein